MAQDLNLIPSVETQTKKGSDINKTVNIAAVIALLISAGILFGLFGYQFFLQSTSERIDSQTEQAEQEILSQVDKEITHNALIDKIEQSDRIVNGSLVYSEGYKIIVTAFNKSGSVLIDGGMSNSGVITLIGDAKSSGNLKKLVDTLNDKAFAADIQNVFLVSLSKEIGKPYRFTIDYDYLNKGLLKEDE